MFVKRKGVSQPSSSTYLFIGCCFGISIGIMIGMIIFS